MTQEMQQEIPQEMTQYSYTAYSDLHQEDRRKKRFDDEEYEYQPKQKNKKKKTDRKQARERKRGEGAYE